MLTLGRAGPHSPEQPFAEAAAPTDMGSGARVSSRRWRTGTIDPYLTSVVWTARVCRGWASRSPVHLAGMIGLEASGGILRFVVAIASAGLLIFILSLFGVFRRG